MPVVARRSEAEVAVERQPLIAKLAYLVLGAALIADVMTLLLRHNGQSWPFIDTWGVDSFELVVALAALARSIIPRPGRGFALVLGLGLLSWGIGDTLWSLEGNPPGISAADVFYLLFYPLVYVAMMILIRSELRAASASVWLDGIVAGLGAAAVCAAFGIDTILTSATGSPLSVAVNMAYPIGDLILLTLVVGALVIVTGWPARLLLLAAGCFVMAIGDTVYLIQSSVGTYQVGTPLDATWAIAIFLLSLSAWQRVGRSRGAADKQVAGFILPTISMIAAVMILMVGNRVHVSAIALGLAIATLLVAGVRRLLTRREISVLAEAKEHQAVTDDLTGLGNRRQFSGNLEAAFRSLDSGGTQGTILAFLFIDLNHFKEINDSFGHLTGDSLLRQLGARRDCTPLDDVLVRLGGDEFGVLLTDADRWSPWRSWS